MHQRLSCRDLLTHGQFSNASQWPGEPWENDAWIVPAEFRHVCIVNWVNCLQLLAVPSETRWTTVYPRIVPSFLVAPAKVGLEQIDVRPRERPFVLEEVQLDQPGRRSVEIPIHSPEEAKARRACREPQGMNREKLGISARNMKISPILLRKHGDFRRFHRWDFDGWTRKSRYIRYLHDHWLVQMICSPGYGRNIPVYHRVGGDVLCSLAHV